MMLTNEEKELIDNIRIAIDECKKEMKKISADIIDYLRKLQEAIYDCKCKFK